VLAPDKRSLPLDKKPGGRIGYYCKQQISEWKIQGWNRQNGHQGAEDRTAMMRMTSKEHSSIDSLYLNFKSERAARDHPGSLEETKYPNGLNYSDAFSLKKVIKKEGRQSEARGKMETYCCGVV
jgi:hypothetical protein